MSAEPKHEAKHSVIWEYRETSSDDLLGLHRLPRRYFADGTVFHGGTCIFCPSGAMRTLFTDHRNFIPTPNGDEPDNDREHCEARDLSVKVCDVCGWWTVMCRRTSSDRSGGQHLIYNTIRHSAAWGVLKHFDIADVSAPIEDLANYLVVRYGERFNIHPKNFEEVVGSVFSNVGCRVRVTSYSRDRGIDIVILEAPGDRLIGVQVRRHRGKIKAEAIRSLAGAMIFNGMPVGAFVTTSSFTRGARATAAELTSRGYPIELLDSAAFYDRLCLSRRPPYEEKEIFASSPFCRFVKDPYALRVVRSYDDLVHGPEFEMREWDEQRKEEDEAELMECHYGASVANDRIVPAEGTVQLSTLDAFLRSLGREFPKPDLANGNIGEESFAKARVPLLVACIVCGMSMPSNPSTPCDEYGQLYCFVCADEIRGQHAEDG